MIVNLLNIHFEAGNSSDVIWTLAGVIIGALITGLIGFFTQERQFKHNKEMFFLQNKGKEEAKDYLLELLNHIEYTDRKFTTLKKRIGAFSEEEIRQMLIEVGALRAENAASQEVWYLRSREDERSKSIPKGYK